MKTTDYKKYLVYIVKYDMYLIFSSSINKYNSIVYISHWYE